MYKKKEAYVKRSDIEEKKAERFKLLMEATKKNLVLEEKRAMVEEKKSMLEEKKVKIATNVEDAMMLSLNLESLHVNARMIVLAICYKMLQRQKDELEVADKEE
ncbi:udp-n-acetylglucosamine--peptide n-acetylglucosaminyltransferase spindly [Hordeum vulgare]|nr:udp-n-acetylglucosamine--peptide n-acetylglucosaminyltransferase spindly [Hordeum vulgare]